MATPAEVLARAERYLQRFGITGVEFDSGTQGHIWRTSRQSALKVHIHEESYLIEREAYIRLGEKQVFESFGFTIPRMFHVEDDLLAIEMEIVFPPRILDFASARFDERPDLIEDPGHTVHDRIRQRFERAEVQTVIDICDDLAARAGIYLLDPHRDNIKFSSETTTAGQSSS